MANGNKLSKIHGLRKLRCIPQKNNIFACSKLG
jgi:hypothetical protein